MIPNSRSDWIIVCFDLRTKTFPKVEMPRTVYHNLEIRTTWWKERDHNLLLSLYIPFQSSWTYTRGGWTGAELHHGSILQYASVYTISHAVRTFGEAIEFLSSFRCKWWTLNVILLHNSSDYLTNTRRSMKTLKTRVFLRSRPRVKTSPRVIDQSFWRRWIYVAISSIYPATFKRLSKRKWLCFPSNAALRFLVYNIFSVIVYIFALFSFTKNWRDMGYFIGTCRAFCVLCQLMSYICIIARLYTLTSIPDHQNYYMPLINLKPRSVTIWMEFSVIPGRIQMERFISSFFSWQCEKEKV